MLDALVIYCFVTTMRQAGYFGFAAIALGAVTACCARLRNMIGGAAAWLLGARCAAAMERLALPDFSHRCGRGHRY